MTMENFDDDTFSNFDEYLMFLVKRMQEFHLRARKEAVRADGLWAKFIDDTIAKRAGIKDDYDKTVKRQEMYDRWTMREASVIRAIVAAKEYTNNFGSGDFRIPKQS